MRRNLQYIAGDWREGSVTQQQVEIFRQTPYSITHLSQPRDIDDAVASASSSLARLEETPAYQRATWLRSLADGLEGRRHDLCEALVAESGKPLMLADGEIDRAVETLRFSADEALRLTGAMVPMDASPRGAHRLGFAIRVPVGIVVGITPFNAPLNLLAHKIGPAIAGGNAIIIKPDPRAAACAVILFEVLAGLGLPVGAVSLVHGGAEVGKQLVVDDRTNLISFTGGKQAAFSIAKQAGLKRVLFELGGNAGNIVNADADIAAAARDLAVNAFGHAGQSCIGVQRIHVVDAVYDAFIAAFVVEVKKIRVGDPSLAETHVGPLIDGATVDRLEGWINEAVQAGATMLHRGERDGLILGPTVLSDVNKDMPIVCEEVFGPVVTIERVANIDAAIASVNDSIYGLQAGVFTSSVTTALRCIKALKVGGVVVNGTSNYRVDHQPYGGVKQSGLGREGPLYALEAMTELRMVVMQ